MLTTWQRGAAVAAAVSRLSSHIAADGVIFYAGRPEMSVTLSSRSFLPDLPPHGTQKHLWF